MRILIAGGGSAGHINPAISIAKKIIKHFPDSEILFIGSQNGLEKDLVPREGFRIKFIDIAGFKRPLGIKSIKTAFTMVKGFLQANKIVKKFNPDIAIGTGGFVSGPAIYAAHLHKAKVLIHEQNAYPGITNRMLSKYADVAMVSYNSSLGFFKKAKSTVLTGNLIDDSFSNMKLYEPKKGKKTVVVIGGSQGAMTINMAVLGMINDFMKPDDFSLIFTPGKRHYEEILLKLNNKLENVTISDYIYDRDKVYSQADLMVIRGGAISISEVLAMGKPSIIIPSPFVPDHAQERNAKQIYDAGACEIIYDNEDMTPTALYEKMNLLLHDEEKLMKISENAYALGIRDANDRVFKEFLEVYNEINGTRK